MNEKQTALINEFISRINGKYQLIFSELASCAISLGYAPVRNKTKDFTIDFRNNRIKKTIMKMEEKEQKHDGYKYGERNIPGLRLKFFANEAYSDMFKEAIRNVIEEFDGKYTGCYGCGSCKGTPQGYVYVYPDGRRVFRCGTELISIFDFTNDHLDEIKNLIGVQADYYLSR